MGNLYLVRHGQASFGADDYDQLSPKGVEQSRLLGEFFKANEIRFDLTLIGSLKRQTQTFQGIKAGMCLPDGKTNTLLWPGLNEYDSHSLITAIHPEPLPKPDTPELYRHHFRLLREGLSNWMSGSTTPHGMPNYNTFLAGVTSALEHVKKNCSGNVLMVSSGGPISMAIGHILGANFEAVIDLNMRIRNSSVTEFIFTPKRMSLLTFNSLAHLDQIDHANLITYA